MSKCGKCGAEHKRNHHWCRPCNRKYDQARSKERNASIRKRSKNPKERLKQLLAVKHSDRSALDFDVMWERLESNGFRCEVTGAEFSWEPRHPQALSIDRIDPSKGYTYDNIRLVCWWLNAAMGNWGLEKLEEMLNDWRQ